MNAIVLLIPILLLRYGLLGFLSRDALKRAAFFPPLSGSARMALWVNLFSNLSMFLYLIFIKIRVEGTWFGVGSILYGLGIILYTISVFNYAKPNATGINLKGLYRFSRNPMYVAYFIYFLGCALLTHSWVLLVVVLVFQISTHWIILAEENWCLKEFGVAYENYMKKVRRYV